MKVLVTGAGGFLGQDVVAALTAQGVHVRAMVRPRADPSDLAWGESVEIVQADLRTEPDLESMLSGIDVVVHLAARVSGSDDERFASTVVGTERLLRAMKGQAVARLVLVSSYSVYDWTAVSGRLTEKSPIAEHPYQRDGYTVAKVWQEKICREASEELGFDLVVLRPGFIWSREKWDVAGLGIRVGRHLLVVGPRTRPPMTQVGNCAEAVSLAVVSPSAEGHTFNVVDTPSLTSWTWAKRLAPPEARQIRVPVPYLMATVLVRAVALASRSAFPAGGRLPSILVPRRFDARFKPLMHSADLVMETLAWAPRAQLEGRGTVQDESPRDRRHDPRRDS